MAFYESDLDRHQLVRFGTNCYDTQFHPEFTPPLLKSIARYIPYGTTTDADQARIASTCECPVSTGILAAFVRQYSGSDKAEKDATAAAV